MILLNFPKKYMKLKKIWAVEAASAGIAPLRSATDDDYYYRPQRSCEGYVFTGVCLSTGGGVSAPRGGVCSGGCLLCTEATGRDGHCCGWYASYWNVFLLISAPGRSAQGCLLWGGVCSRGGGVSALH